MHKFLVSFCLLLWAFFASGANPITGLLERIDPGASKKFVIQVKKGDKDFFELDQKGDRVVVRGNNYVSIATGINWYLKYYAGTHLSWNGMSASLPDVLPPVTEPLRMETNLHDRYDFNYCTYSYTMPFWDWDRWEQEIDWMALHGVNMPLAAVGQECVWRNVLFRLGYSIDEINEFIAGPAFLAWWAMNNLEGWGGPNPDSWYVRQEALQKKILARMAEYGIRPVFPGYSGMMPHNADERLGITLTKVAKPWNGFQRPAFLQPTDPRYAEIAEIYYDEYNRLFGVADFYSMDPFHELSAAEGVDFDAAAQAIMAAMKRNNPKAKWVLQAWSENPREALIRNLRQGDLIILDLFAEGKPMWGIESPARRENGFLQHEWLFCMLENFGGNVGLHGRMDMLLDNFYATKTHPLAKNMTGIGFTMEGSENNPVMFELMSELPWRPEKFTKEDWLKDYVVARYGFFDQNIYDAWVILANSIYNCPPGNIQQGTHESIFCCRPSLDNFQASSWSKMKNYYDPRSTCQAAALMLKAAEHGRGNNNFEYDLVDIVRQSISDEARRTYQHSIADYKCFDRDGFTDHSSRFMHLLSLQDMLLDSRPEFQVGRWLQFAKDAATNAQEADLYEWNARVQVTTWGARENADKGKLRDYAHKEWSGMLRDFYAPRWAAFFSMLGGVLFDGADFSDIDYYAIEEPWTLEHDSYPTSPQSDPIDTASYVFYSAFE